MASDKVAGLNFTFVARAAPQSGPISSSAWSDSFNEISNDLSVLTTQWNNRLTPLLNSLPYGNLDVDIDAWANGLDGANLWVDAGVAATDTDLTFYNSSDVRPYTVKEAFINTYTYVDEQISDIRTDISEATQVLSAAEKSAIGAHIFDASQTSSDSSIDGKAENNRLNISQIAKDLYDTSLFSLDKDGAANLTYSVKDHIEALLALHNGAWDTDLTLNHTGAFSAVQTDVGASTSYNDSFAGAPVNLQEDLNQIRTRIKTLGGTAAWTTAFTALYAGGADSLEELLASTAGTGTKSATNPWGYNWSDPDGLQTRLEAVRDFVGQATVTDTNPNYSSNTFVTDSTSLETAIGALDLHMTTMSGTGADYVKHDGTRDITGDFNFGVNSIHHIDDLDTAGNILASGNITSSGNIYTELDMEVTDSGHGIVLKDETGIRWRVYVGAGGTLLTTAV